jgi:predicted glycogen debranching enzyme
MALYTQETYGELHPSLDREWLITNGLGGFASGTVAGCNTRRYHGLLCAATLPPVGRVMLLNRIGEVIRVAGRENELLELSINQFGDKYHPRGDRFLRRFQLDISHARWDYEIEDIRVSKEVLMPWRKNVIGIRYTVEPGETALELSLLPFVRMMDFHALRHSETNFEQSHGPKSCSVKSEGNKLTINCDAGSFQIQPDWWYGHTYAIETERGLDDREDLFTPGRFIIPVNRATTITLWAGLESAGNFPAEYNWEQEISRRRETARIPATASPTAQKLIHAANDFIVDRKAPDGSAGYSVIAGYPWFADWGRDTMISLPGLLLCPGRIEEAKKVLCVFAQHIDRGMIPNRFDDYTNKPSYNTVDASLWFIHAVFEYFRVSKDKPTFETILRPACLEIIKGYTDGTRYNIKVDPDDGLVSQGDQNTQLTWMDAKANGICFTPRQGKAVEINALWYHALRLVGDDSRANQVAESFRNSFWLSPFRGLADVIDDGRRDVSIRPNQIFAVSLPHSPLNHEQQQAVVEVVRRELLTPVGLRTLDRGNPNYHGRFFGSQFERDKAYHNGTVWPWLIGGFLEAYLKVNKRSDAAVEQARQWLQPLIDQLQTGCIGQIAEIFEADEPHRRVGCCAQAWSVAEVLRLAMELGI